MNPASLLAVTFPHPLRGAMTTIADLAHYKRRGYVSAMSFACHVSLIVETRMAEQRSRGRGNRARRRVMAIVRQIEQRIAEHETHLAADLAHDTATEGYSRRPFRTNIHD